MDADEDKEDQLDYVESVNEPPISSDELREGLDELLGGLKGALRETNREYATNEEPHAQFLRDFSIELTSILSRLEKRLDRGNCPETVQQQSLGELDVLADMMNRYKESIDRPADQG